MQVEIPQPRMTSLLGLTSLPVMTADTLHPLLGDVAAVTYGTAAGEYDRFNGQRMLTLTANTSREDLGRVAAEVDQVIAPGGAPPRGATVRLRGQIAPMRQALRNLAVGLSVAVVAIFLLLAANFQSLRLAAVALSTVPAVLSGVVLALLVTLTTLNIQSFMGAIMAVGVAVANAILLVTLAEQSVAGARSRRKPRGEARRHVCGLS